MSEQPARETSFAFALRVIKLSRLLQEKEKEYVLSKQLMRSGTAIGALIREAEHAESKLDFIHKMSIALKEANETVYWLELLHQAKLLSSKGFDSINEDSVELVKLLTSIVKSAKGRPDHRNRQAKH